MTSGDLRFSKILHLFLKVFMGLAISYFIVTSYVLPWYVIDHYDTAVGTITGEEEFENGGLIYEYQFEVNGKLYSENSISGDDYEKPSVGDKYSIKYLPLWPYVSVPDFSVKK